MGNKMLLMEDKIYARAYREVLEVFKHVEKKSVDKIPKEQLECFQEKQDISYDFKINLSLPFEKLPLMKETKAILANIYRDYWASPAEREMIRKKEEIDLKMIQLKKFKERMDLLGESKESEFTELGKELLDDCCGEMKKLEEQLTLDYEGQLACLG